MIRNRRISATIVTTLVVLSLMLSACGGGEAALCPINEPITVRGDATAWPDPIISLCINDRCSPPDPARRVYTVQYQGSIPNQVKLTVVDEAGKRVTLGETRSEDCALAANSTTITLIGREGGFRLISD